MFSMNFLSLLSGCHTIEKKHTHKKQSPVLVPPLQCLLASASCSPELLYILFFISNVTQFSYNLRILPWPLLKPLCFTADLLNIGAWHFGMDISKFRGCPRHYRILNNMLSPTQWMLVATPIVTTQKMSPDIAQCPLGGKLPPGENNWFTGWFVKRSLVM